MVGKVVQMADGSFNIEPYPIGFKKVNILIIYILLKYYIIISILLS